MMSTANDPVIIGTITMDYEHFYQYLKTRPDEEIKKCAQRILTIAQEKSIDVVSTSIPPVDLAVPDSMHIIHSQEQQSGSSPVHDQSANWANKLTGLFEIFDLGSCGTKYTTMLDGAKVLIKVDVNEIPSSLNALSSESEYIFFKWVSETFTPWPEEIIQPVFFGSLPPSDPLYQVLDDKMFPNYSFQSKTNVSQNNMFVVILPFGEQNDADGDGHQETVRSFLVKFVKKMGLPSSLTQETLYAGFKIQMDHKKAANSVRLGGTVKLIDFGKWGVFMSWCLIKGFCFHSQYQPHVYDTDNKRPRFC